MTVNETAPGPTAKAMRLRAGEWLQQLRTAAGMSQSELAAQIESTYPTTVSQIERGLGRVAPERWWQWADVLGQERASFSRRMIYWFDPHAHHALFGGPHPQDAEGLPREASDLRRGRRKPHLPAAQKTPGS